MSTLLLSLVVVLVVGILVGIPVALHRLIRALRSGDWGFLHTREMIGTLILQLLLFVPALAIGAYRRGTNRDCVGILGEQIIRPFDMLESGLQPAVFLYFGLWLVAVVGLVSLLKALRGRYFERAGVEASPFRICLGQGLQVLLAAGLGVTSFALATLSFWRLCKGISL